MQFIRNICDAIQNVTTIKSEFIYLMLVSVCIITIIRLVYNVTYHIILKTHANSKRKYMYNRSGSNIANLMIIIILGFIWVDYLKNFLTLITFISTAITLSLKDFIFNFFAGIYIRASKVFSLEDRIEVDNLKGDIVNINKTSFDLLEVGERVNGEQSTGRIVHVPNSVAISHPVKNYNKGFKYIWDEIKIEVDLDSDVYKTKKELYRIIKKNSVVKHIPDKMEHEVNDASADYRIYFNNLEPIIYIEVIDGVLEVYLRFLVHPKKKRNVENSIWLDILRSYKEGKIQLIKKV